jgi:hypothetical protein
LSGVGVIFFSRNRANGQHIRPGRILGQYVENYLEGSTVPTIEVYSWGFAQFACGYQGPTRTIVGGVADNIVVVLCEEDLPVVGPVTDGGGGGGGRITLGPFFWSPVMYVKHIYIYIYMGKRRKQTRNHHDWTHLSLSNVCAMLTPAAE